MGAAGLEKRASWDERVKNIGGVGGARLEERGSGEDQI